MAARDPAVTGGGREPREGCCGTCARLYGYTAVYFCDGICAFGHAEPDR